MKFRKKPIIIEAEQWFKGKTVNGVCFCGSPDLEQHVHTLEGELVVSDGDWIITGIKGEKYPCKPDIFKMTYEPIED